MTALHIRTFTPFADEDARERKANAERSAEHMRKLHADPAFAKAHAERSAEHMRKLNADPAFAKAHAAAVSKAQKKRWRAWRKLHLKGKPS
jgi:hypothetical protein